MIWSRSREYQERKTKAILEQLKKDQRIENVEFEYSGKDTILDIMAKIKEYVNENK